MEKTFYAYCGINTRLHVMELKANKTLCGITPPIYWEMSFEGEPYAEIGEYDSNHFASKRPGFHIGSSFAPDRYFCKKCYLATKKSMGIV